MSEKVEEKKVINLRNRVKVKLINDMDSMRKKKGQYITTHPENLEHLVKGKFIDAKDKGVDVTVPVKK